MTAEQQPIPAETSARRHGVRALVVGAYLAIAIGLTWPVALHLDRRLLAHEMSGAWRTVWGYWWTLHHLQEDGAWPLRAEEIAFPAGGPFSSIAPVNDLLSLPLQLTIGLIPAYNVLMLAHLVLAATGAFALARALGLSRGGAFLAGALYGFNPFMLTYSMASCVVETTGQAWIPWFLLSVLRLVRAPGPGVAVASGLLFAVTGLSSFYWALLVAMFSPWVAVGELLDRRRRGEPMVTRAMVGWTALALAVALVCFWVPAQALLGTYEAQGAVLEGYSSRKQRLLHPSLLASHVHDLATLGGYFLPGKALLPVHEDLDRLSASTYAGWLALALASFGLGRGRWRWLALGLAGLLLSVGPFFFVAESAYRPGPMAAWLTLRDLFPPIKLVTSYIRFSVVFFLALGLLAAWGVEALAPRRLRGALALLATAGALAELVWVSPVPVPLPSAEVYIPEANVAIGQETKPGAVIDWPQRYPGRKVEVSRYFYYQSAHKRPIPYDFAPTSYRPGAIEANPFFGALERVTYGSSYHSGAWTALTGLPVERGLQDLLAMGYGWLILHPEHVDPARLPELQRWLERNLKFERRFDDGSAIYALK